MTQNKKLREPDLNRRPRGYEPRELPGCSIPHRYSSHRPFHVECKQPVSKIFLANILWVSRQGWTSDSSRWKNRLRSKVGNARTLARTTSCLIVFGLVPQVRLQPTSGHRSDGWLRNPRHLPSTTNSDCERAAPSGCVAIVPDIWK